MKEQVKRGVNGPEAMDYTPAMRYGEIRFITDFDLPLYGTGTLTEAWWKAVHRFVKEFDEKIDFLVATGQPLAMVLIGYALGVHEFNPTFLIWRREENKYIPFKPLMSAPVGLIIPIGV